MPTQEELVVIKRVAAILKGSEAIRQAESVPLAIDKAIALCPTEYVADPKSG